MEKIEKISCPRINEHLAKDSGESYPFSGNNEVFVIFEDSFPVGIMCDYYHSYNPEGRCEIGAGKDCTYAEFKEFRSENKLKG